MFELTKQNRTIKVKGLKGLKGLKDNKIICPFCYSGYLEVGIVLDYWKCGICKKWTKI